VRVLCVLRQRRWGAGGVDYLRETYGNDVDIVAGPATDNAVGQRFVERLGIPARNARVDPRALGELALQLVRRRLSTPV
jgi:hypothetical protein